MLSGTCTVNTVACSHVFRDNIMDCKKFGSTKLRADPTFVPIFVKICQLEKV
jgi:hypothetical protein